MSDVSVVMCTYNGELYILEQLQSIVHQKNKPMEIIIGDDGSTDDTIGIIKDFRKTCDIPILIIENDVRMGYADNFLDKAMKARGKYIAFCDQDDIWMPQKIAKCLEAIMRDGSLMCVHSMRVVDEYKNLIYLDDQGIKEDAVIAPCSSDPWGVYFGLTMMFDRSILNILPANERGNDSYNPKQVLSHDRWIFFLATTFGTVTALSEPLVEYRQHRKNVFGVKKVGLKQRFLNKVEEGPAKLLYFYETSDKRARQIEYINSIHAFRFGMQAKHWQKINKLCKNRYNLYLCRNIIGRICLFVKNLQDGTYRNYSHGGLGQKRMLEDLVLGVFGPVFLQRGQ